MKRLGLIILLGWLTQSVFAQDSVRFWDGPWVLRVGAAEVDVGVSSPRIRGQLNAGFGKRMGKRWQVGIETVGHIEGNSSSTSSTWGWRTDPWWLGISSRLFLGKFPRKRSGVFPFVGLSAGGMLWSGFVSRNPNGNRLPRFPRAWQWGLSPRAGLIWRMTPQFSAEVLGIYLPYASREENQITYFIPHDLSLSVNFSYYFHPREE